MRGTGDLVSIGSVILLGLVAWPRNGDPAWHLPALLLGMALSIVGMALRWHASRRRETHLHEVERATGIRQPAK